MSVLIRAATEADLSALTRLDLTYPTDHYLALERRGQPPEHIFSFRWRSRVPEKAVAVYADYALDGLRDALTRTDLFLVSEIDEEIVGLLMIVVSTWTDAAEITDLAVGAPHRRQGCGRALIVAAAEWARQRGVRLLWVEPRADNAGAIEFYLSLGFRICAVDADAEGEEGARVAYMCLALG